MHRIYKYIICDKSSQSSGMTLVELLVVVSIFVVITGLLIFDYGTFRSSTSLSNTSTNIGLSIRKAQSYAIGAYGASSTFTYPYGIHFSTNVAPVADPSNGTTTSYALFTDVSGNYMYNSDGVTACSSTPTASNECTELASITTAEKIVGIYLDESASPIPTGGVVDIVFMRPNPDAYFCYRSSVSNSSCDSGASVSHVKIKVQSTKKISQGTGIKIITIWNTGQISVQ
jgi:prepilin-type N-terminal cleavage/methylation domain-containing protein